MALVACKSEGADCRVKNNSRASELQAAGMHIYIYCIIYIYIYMCVYNIHDTFGKSTNIAGQCCLLHILVLPQTKEPCRVLQSLLVRTDAKMVLTSHWRRHKAKGFFLMAWQSASH